MSNDPNLHLKITEGLGDPDLHLGGDVQVVYTHEGELDVVLDALAGGAATVRHTQGTLDVILGNLAGGLDRSLEPLIGDGFAPRHEQAEADYVLESLLGDVEGVVTHIRGVIPYICSVQGNAITLRASTDIKYNHTDKSVGNICSVQSIGTERIKTTCFLYSNAVLHRSQIKTYQTLGVIVRKINCIRLNNTPVLRATVCGHWSNGKLISNDNCIVVGEATPLSAKTCSNTGDASATRYNIVTEVFPDGKPFIPNGVYTLREYDTGFELLSIRPERALTPTVFKIKVRDFSNTDYQLDEYQRETFYIEYDTFPPENIELGRKTQLIKYASAKSAPYQDVEFQGRSPISVGNCILMDYGDFMKSSKCFTQGLGGFLTRNTCTPYDDYAEIVAPPIPPIDPPTTGTTFVVPVQDSYTMLNEFDVKLPDDTFIDLGGIRLGVSSDAFAWNWSSTLLDHSKKAVLTPTNDGTSVILIATINGYEHHLVVEKMKKRTRFEGSEIQISGRGLSALLDTPYQVKTSLRIDEIQTNQQIAETLIPQGWTIEWELPLWNVPAGTYSHNDKSPINALKDLVTKCGGMIVPNRTEQKLKVIKRYPVLPWYFANVNPDMIVSDDVIMEVTEEPDSNYGANGVWVSGTDNGSQALVRLSGTAGDRLAQTQNNELMVDSVALRTLGERVLSGAYVQPVYNDIRTPLDSVITPLFEMGMLVKIEIDGGDDRGIVNSVDISVGVDTKGATAIHQSITMGETTSNLFSRFSKILPVSSTVIGKALSVIGSTHTVMELVGLENTKVRGEGVVGKSYYITDGVITGEAPTSVVIADIIV